MIDIGPPIGLWAQAVCIWEATARKPGNVHPGCEFPDTDYVDFLLSAAAIAPEMERAPHRPVGCTVHDAILATRQVVTTNTNLGIILLLAPLAAVAEKGDGWRDDLEQLLGWLNVDDSYRVYEAIRLAHPWYLGRVPHQDVRSNPTRPLRQLMALAADRDTVARQYDNGFRDVFSIGLPALVEELQRSGSLESAIIFCHLRWIASIPDSLIARKRGAAEATEAGWRAQAALDAWPDRDALADLDTWLRAEGNTRNPGTSADLVTASLFVALRERILTLPSSIPWTLEHH